MTEPGPVTEEAARLIEAVQAWARAAGAAATEHLGGSQECRLCPICSLIGVLRSGRPETFEHLLDATGSLLAALRSAVEAHEEHWSRRRGAPLERIDIG